MRIIAIVEGHGEAAAVPILIRRIVGALLPGVVPDVPRPIRVKRQRVLKEGDLDRARENSPSFDKLWRDVMGLL